MSLTIIRKVSVTGGTVLRAANNLGDVASAATSFTNIKQAATTSATGVSARASSGDAETDDAKHLTIAEFLRRLGPYRNALAPRQALAFDATARASFSTTLGAGDFTIALVASQTSAALSAYILRPSSGASISLYGAGDSRLYYNNGSGDVFFAAFTKVNTPVHIALVRASGLATLYFDGVAVAGPTANPTDYSGVLGYLGGAAGSAYWSGTLCLLGIYNRALSAAEVLALYNQGAPAAGDYNRASNTSFATGDDSTFASAGNWAVNGASTISGGKLNLSSGDNCVLSVNPITIGKPVRFTVTVDSITAGNVQYYNGSAYVNFASAAGTYTVEFVPVASYAGIGLRTSGGNAVLDTFLGYNVGLLCAPEANAPGNGYQWRDMSGNMADITVPVSGVAWALPDTRPNRVRGTLTWAGTQESKSLLGQRAFPDGAVRTLLTLKPTASTSGSGTTVGSTNTAARWRAAAALTANTKAVATLANQLPAGTADADNDLVIDPDTANFTGSIAAEMHYTITEGT